MSDPSPTIEFEPPVVLETAQRLRAVSHPLRLRIFAELTIQGRLRTSDIAAALGEPANKTSYHLTTLERCGVIAKAEPPASSTDRRETWWRLASESGFTWDLDNPELDAVMADLEAAGDAVMAELRTRSYPILRAGGWHAIDGQLPVELTKAEADEFFGRLLAIMEDLFTLRRRRQAAREAGTPEPTDASYLIDLGFFPFDVRTPQPPVS